MENLWQRLKPTVKKQVLANEKTYPYGVNNVKEQFKNNIFWSDLSIDTVKMFICYTHLYLSDISISDFTSGERFIIKRRKNNG